MVANTYLIVGLGNPGREYKNSRHNVGFMVIDRLSIRLNTRMSRMQAKALVASTKFEGNNLILAKPQTYMNLSGQSVQSLSRFYKIELTNMIVAHDDLDLPFGTIRIRPGGGPGGQKGVASTIDRLGTKSFRRLRIGIGRPLGRMDPAAYVLQNFPDSDKGMLSEILDHSAAAILSIVAEGIDSAMNKFNGDV